MKCSLYVDVDSKSVAEVNDGLTDCWFSGGIKSLLWCRRHGSSVNNVITLISLPGTMTKYQLH